MDYKIPEFEIDLRDGTLVMILGPCVIESRDHALGTADKILQIVDKACEWAGEQVQVIFKASYDKANRTSGKSFRGPGLEEGLAILAEIRETLELPVLSDVHETHQVKRAAEVLDILQIPAFLCRQTDLIEAACRTGKMVNVKKGQFLAPDDMNAIVDKAGTNARNLLLTERGASFGYHNLVVDFRSFKIMRSFGCPVIFDVTHSIQIPGGQGSKSGGAPEFIPMLARAGAACGYVDGFFMEVHEDPAKAKSDGANALKLDLLPQLLREILAIRAATRDTRDIKKS